MQCTVKADHGDSAPATSWRAPPTLHYIAPHCAAHDPNRLCRTVQFSALAGDKQLEEELRASLKCSLPVRGWAPPGFYSPNWEGVATSGARSKCNFHLPQRWLSSEYPTNHLNRAKERHRRNKYADRFLGNSQSSGRHKVHFQAKKNCLL